MYKFLYIEDSETDAYLFDLMVKGGDTAPPLCSLTRAETLDDGLEMLETKHFDGAIVDLALPDSKGLATLDCVKMACPDIPIIVLTGSDNEALAVAAMAGGAQDYLVKSDVTRSEISRSVRHSIERQRLMGELQVRNAELEAALAEVKRLQGMIRMCCVCKRVVNEDGVWQDVAAFVHEHSEACFTHGYCPDCSKRTRTEIENCVRNR